MKITVDWYDPETKSILIYHFSDGWTWNDYINAGNEAVQLISSVPHTVHTIMDVRDVSLVPKGAITQMRRAVSIEPQSNNGQYVIVGSNSNVIGINSV